MHFLEDLGLMISLYFSGSINVISHSFPNVTCTFLYSSLKLFCWDVEKMKGRLQLKIIKPRHFNAVQIAYIVGKKRLIILKH